jgi:hypothetical protein
MTKIVLIINFVLVASWLYFNKEQMQGVTKKLKPLRNGPLEIVEKVSDNAFTLSLPP